jgi:xanthosine utilization system XapX-like protein
METVQDRLNRQLFPALVPRCLAITTLATALAWAHAQIRPRVLAHVSGVELQRLYVTVTSTALISPAILGIMGTLIGYFYHLRNRQVHTSLSEAGLAVRSV